ncbi:hypothetical protein [Owenweeksia hongkongensis]|uniref:hypothetical protein n=1 Tax=Owenweeksia hongkongensis TaxID=253245 RepID=UPI003A934849
MVENEIKTKDLKLFSQRSITIATFLGGPLAAGYLIRENYRALDKTREGNNALILGVVSSILIFAEIFSIPESILDTIPRQLIPFVYTAIVYLIVELTQGSTLKQHKENGNDFFSGWRAAGFGLISLVILSACILGYTLLSPVNPEFEKYDAKIAQFTKNETETLGFYDRINNSPSFALLSELDTRIIPKWKENIEIIKEISEIENLPNDLVKQNKVLLKYSELRLEAFELFRKAISQDTDLYAPRLEILHKEIDEELDKLNG